MIGLKRNISFIKHQRAGRPLISIKWFITLNPVASCFCWQLHFEIYHSIISDVISELNFDFRNVCDNWKIKFRHPTQFTIFYLMKLNRVCLFRFVSLAHLSQVAYIYIYIYISFALSAFSIWFFFFSSLSSFWLWLLLSCPPVWVEILKGLKKNLNWIFV